MTLHRHLCVVILAALVAAQAVAAPLTATKQPSGRMAVELGDLLLTPEQAVALSRDKSLATGNAWPLAAVYYEFAADVSSDRRALAVAFMSQWSNNTAIRLIESSIATNRILISNDPGNIGCGSSFVGMVGGVQDLKIRCWEMRTIVHEFGHALGAKHEHQRNDRSSYISITDSNNLAGRYPAVWDANFGLVPGGSINSAYDYASVMHYSRTGNFTINEESFVVTLSALAAQPAGAPAGSAGACLSASQCSALLGQQRASPRDLYGKALRYGRRLDRLESYRPLQGSLSVSSFFSGCGTDCWRVAADSTVTVSLTATSGHMAVLAGDCNVRGFGTINCQIDTSRNTQFIAFTMGPQQMAGLLPDLARAPKVFANGFE